MKIVDKNDARRKTIRNLDERRKTIIRRQSEAVINRRPSIRPISIGLDNPAYEEEA